MSSEMLLPTTFPSIEPAAPGHWLVSADQQQWMHSVLQRVSYYVPVLRWLPRYALSELSHDVAAGLTVSFVIIPQGLSYAQALVNVPPVFGLYTAIVGAVCYALLGTSRQMAVGPEALVSIMVGAAVTEFTAWRDGTSAHVLPMLNVQATALLCLMIGIFTFVLGFFRLGFLDSVLSRALLRGFVLAVAVVVIIDMSDALLGLTAPQGQCSQPPALPTFPELPLGTSPFLHLLTVLENLHLAHFLTTATSVLSISLLFAAKHLKTLYKHLKWVQVVPEILLLVAISTALTRIFRWDCDGLAILGKVTTDTSGYDVFPLPTLAKIKHLTLSAVLISIIGFVESIAVAKLYAAKHDYVVSPNRELVAMGTANIVSSFFGCFPAFGFFCIIKARWAGPQSTILRVQKHSLLDWSWLVSFF